MEIVTFIWGVGEKLWGPVTHQIGYLVHYKKNLENLKAKVEALEALRKDNQESVRAAEMNGEEIKAQVQIWLKGADAAIVEVEKVIDDFKLNKRCLWGCCPDCTSRYKLSRKAVKDAVTIGELQDKGKFERVSLQIRKPLEIESMIATGDFEAFESTQQAMNEVMKALRDDNVNVIGVYGMGGVGKTTMVEQVSVQARRDELFDHVVKAVVSQNVNLKMIQGQIADMLAVKLDDESEAGRAGHLKERIMRGRRILIFLDDLWGRIELTKIGVPSGRDLEACKSKIILTTRLENVCHAMESQAKVPLHILSEQDSWRLFRKKAGNAVDSPDFHDVAWRVVKECGGLPIALVVVARALGDKDLEEWKEAARQLEMSNPTKDDHDHTVFRCIKLSYDYLKLEDAKRCFLNCCLFPEDTNIYIEDLVKYGIGQGLFQNANTVEEARAATTSLLKHLKACSLLLNSDQEGCVKMHDVVRDTAISIASAGDELAFLVHSGAALKKWPRRDSYEAYTAISLMSNEIQDLPDGLVCPKLQTLLLQNNIDIQEIPDAFFERMESLRVLDVNGADISSLPSSLGLLLNLRTLCLDGCKSTDILILGELRKLEILSLRESCIEELPEEIGKLVSLRMLDLTMSSDLKRIRSNLLLSLSQLEEIYLQGSFGDWGKPIEGMDQETNAGFDELTRLPCLNTLKVDITDAGCIPQNVVSNPNWVKFNICMSEDLFVRLMDVHLSKIMAARSRALILNTTINTLPDWFNTVVTEKTEKLFYTYGSGLHNIISEYDQGRLNGLKSLLVQSCYGIVQLMNTDIHVLNRPVFDNLEELRVHNMDYLKVICVGELPPGSLRKLKFFQVEQCDELVGALLQPNLLQRLENLEVLDVSGNSLEDIFRSEGLGKEQILLRKLREMKLDKLPQLKNIWNGPAELAIFNKLKILTVIACKKLRNLFAITVSRCLLQLEELWIEDCGGLEVIIGEDEGEASSSNMSHKSRVKEIVEKQKDEAMEKIILPQLKNLSLQNLPLLTGFYSGFASIQCPSLEQLHTQDCPLFRATTDEFHSRKQVQVNNEQRFLLLRKRYG
ncbi:hypothetical protein PVL29_014840 [Vitis rotundifolia]|uniref:NB-ARC domain-containing protein n=1 Tax=Vitis rotundifolia TaxID=103349 RepID=A0AA38ZJE8_VITRO|nr:hypothetical protein PVL29_014840 [Vitis rotundifolia]